MEDVVCWADATPAVRVPLRWMEPYQLDVPTWGVVERRLKDGRRGEEKENNKSIRVFQNILKHKMLKDCICASVCAHLARSVLLLMLLDRSSSLS